MNGQTLVKAFVPLPAGSQGVYTAPGLTYYRHGDWLGSSRFSSTPVRGCYYDLAYAPFGEDFAHTMQFPCAKDPVDLDFTGQNQDTVGGMYDFLYREYAPTQGRWISPDPAGMAAVDPSNPQTWNRYAYVANDPLNSTDQLGLLCSWDDGTFDDSPEDGGATYADCSSQGGRWIDTQEITVSYLIDFSTGVTGAGGTIWDWDFTIGRWVQTGRQSQAASKGPGSLQKRIVCANKFANDHSVAAAFGAQNTFVGKALGGNIFGGIGELGVAVFGKGDFSSADGAALAYGGASLGVPIPGRHPGLSGAGAVVQDGIVKAGAQFGYNILTGGAQLSTEAGCPRFAPRFWALTWACGNLPTDKISLTT